MNYIALAFNEIKQETGVDNQTAAMLLVADALYSLGDKDRQRDFAECLGHEIVLAARAILEENTNGIPVEVNRGNA